ncbi:hydroxyacid dehydrogenase [Leifsonia virtsii]|uniref:Hydroxyacid dehydrogenase n=1 Tax=Leifsonia virtsii TaxID=3035915 RepID=A0ABT8J339_9MICO|nr:hydroxyacid dehydrogenase [Leifsonia virtsii]MDN4598997.1 hydroxyacid dehydrogenase [Leifsonia virtsii]
MTAVRTPVAAFAMRPDLPPLLFSGDDLRALRAVTRLDPDLAIADLDDAPAELLDEVEILITGWGAPRLGRAELDRMPRLRAIVHAAGTVKGHLDDAAWDRGILVTSAASANAFPVAEYTLAMILLAGKRVPDYIRGYAADPGLYGEDPDPRIGNFQRTVGIVGASRVGRRVIELLAPFDIDVLLYDPYLHPGDPILDAVRRVPLDDLFAGSSIVSIHAPLLPETVGMVGAAQLALLPDGATLINTARAPIVDQEALAAAVRDRGLRAVLDVTDPEPLPAGHPLRTLPGVIITPHVAGALGTELRRLGECARHEIERFVAGEPAEHPVTKEALIAVA